MSSLIRASNKICAAYWSIAVLLGVVLCLIH
jgi:hypothetical protein